MWLLFLTCAAYTFRGYWRTMIPLLHLFLLRMVTWSILSASLRLNDFKLWPLMTLKKKSRWSCGPTMTWTFVAKTLSYYSIPGNCGQRWFQKPTCESWSLWFRGHRTSTMGNALWNCGWGSENKIWSLLEKLCPAYVLHLATFCSSVASSVKNKSLAGCVAVCHHHYGENHQIITLSWLSVCVLCMFVCVYVCVSVLVCWCDGVDFGRIAENLWKECWQLWCKKMSGIKVLLTLLISTLTSSISFIQLSSFNCLQCFRDIRRLVFLSDYIIWKTYMWQKGDFAPPWVY